MTDYCKLRVSAVYSQNSDYSSPLVNLPIADYIPTTAVKNLATMVYAATGGTTVELGNFNSTLLTVVKNMDTTNYVTVTRTFAAATQTDRIVPGGIFVTTTPFTISGDLILTANTATCICEVFIAGT